MSAPRHDVSAVRTLCTALSRPADAHDYAITDIYATQDCGPTVLKLVDDDRSRR